MAYEGTFAPPSSLQLTLSGEDGVEQWWQESLAEQKAAPEKVEGGAQCWSAGALQNLVASPSLSSLDEGEHPRWG